MAIKKLTEAGFKDIDVKSIEGGIIKLLLSITQIVK